MEPLYLEGACWPLPNSPQSPSAPASSSPRCFLRLESTKPFRPRLSRCAGCAVMLCMCNPQVRPQPSASHLLGPGQTELRRETGSRRGSPAGLELLPKKTWLLHSSPNTTHKGNVQPEEPRQQNKEADVSWDCGLPCWSTGEEPALQRRGHPFNLRSGKIPHVARHLSSCAATPEPLCCNY